MNMPSINDLTPSEKLQLVEFLWDDLAADPSSVPLHEWQRQELLRRREKYEADPGPELTWEEVERRVREQLRDAR